MCSLQLQLWTELEHGVEYRRLASIWKKKKPSVTVRNNRTEEGLTLSATPCANYIDEKEIIILYSPKNSTHGEVSCIINHDQTVSCYGEPSDSPRHVLGSKAHSIYREYVHRMIHLSIMRISEPFQTLIKQEEHNCSIILRHKL